MNGYEVVSNIKPYKEVICIVSWRTNYTRFCSFICSYYPTWYTRAAAWFDARPVKSDTGRWCSVTDNNAINPLLPFYLNFLKIIYKSLMHTFHMYTINTRSFKYIEWHYNKGRLFFFFSSAVVVVDEMKMKCWVEPPRNRRGAIHHII